MGADHASRGVTSLPGPARVAAVLVSPQRVLKEPPYPGRAALGVAAVGLGHAGSLWLATQLSPHALVDPLLVVPAVFLVAWVAYAAITHALVGEHRRFWATLGVVAWGFTPTLLIAVARPLHWVLRTSSQGLHPRALALGPPRGVLAVGAIALLWQAYVTAGGVVALRGIPRRRAAIAAGIPLIAVYVSAALAEPLAIPDGLVPAVALVVVSLLPATVPRGLLSFTAAIELAGDRGPVNPESRYVTVYRLAGGGMLLLALLLVGAGRLLL